MLFEQLRNRVAAARQSALRTTAHPWGTVAPPTPFEVGEALAEVDRLTLLTTPPDGHLLEEALTELRGIRSSYQASGDPDEAYAAGALSYAIEALEHCYVDCSEPSGQAQTLPGILPVSLTAVSSPG